MTLHDPIDDAIVPASRLKRNRVRQAERTEVRLAIWARALLIILAACWVTVFGVALSLDPYTDAGVPLTMETHRQLGLPACTFKELTGLPCPSCGMTTSFALLIRGDVVNSARANFAGMALAAFGLLFVPWSIAAVAKGRLLFIREPELLAFWLAIGLLVLIFGRWGIVLLIAWLMPTAQA
jgi:hypothetical protein